MGFETSASAFRSLGRGHSSVAEEHLARFISNFVAVLLLAMALPNAVTNQIRPIRAIFLH